MPGNFVYFIPPYMKEKIKRFCSTKLAALLYAFSHWNLLINNVVYRTRVGDGAIENRNDIEPDGKASIATSNCDKTSDSNPPSGNDATYASQLSLENPAGFSRDAFGRQSMSEKRHATLDAKNTGTYQRNKKLREEREKTKPKDGT